ncbi:unnamed protein product [Didymodactylos carnosus]|uniref:NAD(P)(+)--arginine ADP-ribosyltransferase n=1 Tax=Didymodactylos carnosus TaxID=1234261 RepID=A0A815V1X0_9BILA|nr:unnamed protein product [Didymodactylos carnosus]CAF1527402.1 unnamed protein product [Didymodactylos carnosus]CAF4196616.1 unnamed protein product [Didymodactylos carnosus]CAF4386548.1 unnamed protein product [Didymodactylos carnosus]
MSSSEKSRKMQDILKDLCAFNPMTALPLDRLPHDCYMISVGGLTNMGDIKELKRMVDEQQISSQTEVENQAEYGLMNSENMESFLELIELAGSTEQLENERKSHYVYEDNFNSQLKNMIKSTASFQYLVNVCYRYEKTSTANVDKVMAAHNRRAVETYLYFVEKNVTKDEAKAMAFALSFYTGAKSETCSRGASLIARKGNDVQIEEKTVNELEEAAIILYYLVKALSYIPFYWGYVTRACRLTFDEIQMYYPGRVVTWIQFSSSKKGKQGHDSNAFKERNILFKIYSLTGRLIRRFSNYDDEDEVLFLPHSTFIVFNRKVYSAEQKQVIYMRQVELGFCKWSVLWVDDQIFDENWENKEHMEYAAIQALDLNVHFIPKSSTDSALSFLRSAFGQRLKNQDKFRIVTDMNRENEVPIHNAGARLIKAVRQMGFKNECMVFTSDKKKAERILSSELSSREQQGVIVSTYTEDLRNFVNFDRPREQKTGKKISVFASHAC